MELKIYLGGRENDFSSNWQWDLNVYLNLSRTGSKSYETQSLQLLLGGKVLFLYRTAENKKSSITYLSSITHLAEYSTPLLALLAWGDMYYSAKVSKRHNSSVKITVLTSLTDADALLKTDFILSQGYGSAIGSCQKSSLKQKTSRP